MTPSMVFGYGMRSPEEALVMTFLRLRIEGRRGRGQPKLTRKQVWWGGGYKVEGATDGTLAGDRRTRRLQFVNPTRPPEG